VVVRPSPCGWLWAEYCRAQSTSNCCASRECIQFWNSRAAFGFRVSMHVGREQIEVTTEWLEGHDATVFESFQGYLKTTITSLANPKQ
jgi:hypothetical protein